MTDKTIQMNLTDKIKNKYGVELCYEKGDRKTEEQ